MYPQIWIVPSKMSSPRVQIAFSHQVGSARVLREAHRSLSSLKRLRTELQSSVPVDCATPTFANSFRHPAWARFTVRSDRASTFLPICSMPISFSAQMPAVQRVMSSPKVMFSSFAKPWTRLTRPSPRTDRLKRLSPLLLRSHEMIFTQGKETSSLLLNHVWSDLFQCL